MDSSIKLDIVAKLKDEASAGLHNLTGTIGQTAAGVALGTAAFQAAKAGLDAISGAVVSTINTTTELGKATNKLARETGMSAEQASGMLAVFKRFGVDADGASKSLGIFSRNIANAADGNKTASKAFTDLGINIKDAHGALLPTNDILLKVADKFKTMPAGADKTAEAMKLFGKSGKDLLPILNQGADGIAALEAHAKKLGVVLTQDNLDAIKKNAAAQKDLDEAMTGLQLTIGTALMPIIASLSSKLSEFISSDRFKGWINDVKAALHALATVWSILWPPVQNFTNILVQTLTPALMQIWNNIQQNLIPALQNLWQKVGPLLGPALKDLAIFLGASLIAALLAVAFTINLVVTVVTKLANFFAALPAAIGAAVNMIGGWINWLKDHWAEAVGYIIGFVATLPIKLPLLVIQAVAAMIGYLSRVNWGAVASGIINAFGAAWNWVTSAAMGAFNYITHLNWGAILSGIGKGLANAVIGLIEGGINGALAGIPGSPKVRLPRFASGVQNYAGGEAIVGENGPERVILPAGSTVVPNSQINNTTNAPVHIENVNLTTAEATNEFFTMFGRSQLLVGKGLAPYGH